MLVQYVQRGSIQSLHGYSEIQVKSLYFWRAGEAWANASEACVEWMCERLTKTHFNLRLAFTLEQKRNANSYKSINSSHTRERQQWSLASEATGARLDHLHHSSSYACPCGPACPQTGPTSCSLQQSLPTGRSSGHTHTPAPGPMNHVYLSNKESGRQWWLTTLLFKICFCCT